MTTSRDQTSERGQGPASVPGNSGRAQSQSKREGPSLEEIARVVDPIAWAFYDRYLETPGMGAEVASEVRASLASASAIQALFSTVGSDSRVRELETERDEAQAAAEAWERKAVERMFNIVAAETRVRELEEALREIEAFAQIRSKDDGATFARVNRAALRTIAEKAGALLSQPSPTDGETDA